LTHLGSQLDRVCRVGRLAHSARPRAEVHSEMERPTPFLRVATSTSAQSLVGQAAGLG
jgi:hypothetical protein